MDLATCAGYKEQQLTCVNSMHHGLKHAEADVWDWDDASLLLLVVAIKHCPAAKLC